MYGALVRFSGNCMVDSDIVVAEYVEELYYKLSKLFIQMDIYNNGYQFFKDFINTYEGGNRCEYQYEGLHIVIISNQDELKLWNPM